MAILQGQKVVFNTYDRVAPEKRDPNLYYYEVSHNDDGFTPYAVSKRVMINHLATIAVKKPLKMKTGDSYLFLTARQTESLQKII